MYPNRTLEIIFDNALRHKLIDAVVAPRESEAAGDVAHSHNNPARCRGCGLSSKLPGFAGVRIDPRVPTGTVIRPWSAGCISGDALSRR